MPLNSKYSYGPATTGPASLNASSVVAPLIASTTRMPLPVVRSPSPVVFAIRSAVLPLAVPPLTTSRSEGEPSVPRNVFIPSVPPAPV